VEKRGSRSWWKVNLWGREEHGSSLKLWGGWKGADWGKKNRILDRKEGATPGGTRKTANRPSIKSRKKKAMGMAITGWPAGGRRGKTRRQEFAGCAKKVAEGSVSTVEGEKGGVNFTTLHEGKAKSKALILKGVEKLPFRATEGEVVGTREHKSELDAGSGPEVPANDTWGRKDNLWGFILVDRVSYKKRGRGKKGRTVLDFKRIRSAY